MFLKESVKNIRIFVFLFFCTVFLIQGCSSLKPTPKEEFEIYLDSKVDTEILEVIENWGQPDKEIISTKKYSKRYWIFETSQTQINNNTFEYAGFNNCKVVFITDEKDSIKFWVTEGDGCVMPSEYIDSDW